MAKVPVDRLADAVQKVLRDYAQDVDKDINDLTRAIGKKGAQAVKQASAGAFGGGAYSKSWTSTLETSRFGSTAVIHSKKPGLPHLLENGHAKRNGGRVSGRSHIAPVEEKLVEEFQKAVEQAL